MDIDGLEPTLEDALPAHLRIASPGITRIAAGMSSAGVYRVECGGDAYVLKITADEVAVDAWRRRLAIQLSAAEAGLAPRVVHVDEARRAVLVELVVDRSFPAYYGNPATRADAVVLLGTMLRRMHAIPIPEGLERREPRGFLATLWSAVDGFPLPPHVGDIVRARLDGTPPGEPDRFVLSHNDVNPSNLVFDGERLMLLDWETAAPNDPYYDLATIALFARMDDATCLELLTIHAGEAVSELPARFLFLRRLVATLAGTAILCKAREGGHPGASGDETLEATERLGEFYAAMMSGAVSIASAEGQWRFGNALIRESTAL